MELVLHLNQLIANIKWSKKKLTINDTLKVLEALKHLSEDSNLLENCIHLIQTATQKTNHISALTPRENQVFKLIGLGYKSKEIGKLLKISTDTVGTHRKNIIKKLCLKGSGKLQKVAFQHANSN